jgi:hypothetical protein
MSHAGPHDSRWRLASMTHASLQLQLYYNNSYDETFLMISRE